MHHRVYAARLFPGLVVAQALHRFEEFVSGSGAFFPGFVLPREVFALAGLSYLSLLLALVPSVQHRRRWALWLGAAVAGAETANGLAALVAAAARGGAVPGAWTAPLIVGFGGAYLAVSALGARRRAASRGSARPPLETRSG
jgi:hypothetical protein